MTDKLNDNDRQRIEQFAERILFRLNLSPHDALFKIAEYATLFERQQNEQNSYGFLKAWNDEAEQKIKQLEAERSTLLKAVDLLKRTRYPFPEQPTLQEEIELFLNSLKTK